VMPSQLTRMLGPSPAKMFTLLSALPLVKTLGVFFAAREVAAYLFGGCLRDSLLGRQGKDVDIILDGDPLVLGKELADLLGGAYVVLDRERAVARVVTDGGVVDLGPLGGSVEESLARRDFTVDAMALPVYRAQDPRWIDGLLDPYDGMGDLDRRLIRMVSPSVFRDDPVRLLRGVRLAGALGFEIEGETRRLMAASAGLVSKVSPDRVRDELLTLLSLKGAKNSLHCLDDLGLLCPIIPELETARGVDQPKEHYWDVFEHTMQTVDAVERVTAVHPRDPFTALMRWDADAKVYLEETISDGHNRRTMLKLGALFHDIAKPQTKAVDATGRTRFLGHATQGASIAAHRLRSMRLSGRGVRAVAAMVEHHLRPAQMSQGLDMPSPRAVYRFNRDLKENAAAVLYFSLADYMAARGPLLEMEGWRRRVDLVNHVLNESSRERFPASKERLVTGHHLKAVLGLEPGPQFRTLLEDVEEAQATGEVETPEDALEWVKDRLEKMEGEA